MPNTELLRVIQTRFPDSRITPEETRDNILTIWVPGKWILEVLQYLKNEINKPFRMLYDLTGIDMRAYNRQGLPPEFPFVVVYQLLSFDRNSHIKIKVGLKGDSPEVPSITGIWRNANWYEREAWDMFGIRFNGYPHLTRLLMPHYWEGHPLRKDHPARATEMGPYHLPDDKMEKEENMLQFVPEDWGMKRHSEDSDFMFLNLGPQHPGTHGVFRMVLQLSGEDIIDIVPDIGFHHRADEKMAERQSWHTYIPYTDRVDYLGGVINNLA
jgi:NADH-quinone oxidoreductase subunit C/D